MLGVFVFLNLFFCYIIFSDDYKLKLNESTLQFSANYLTFFYKVAGCTEFEGQIYWDPNDLKRSVFQGYMKVDSIKTGFSSLDKKLLSKSFFYAKAYPTIYFSSSKITWVKDNRYLVNGVVTVKGIQKMIEQELTVLQDPLSLDKVIFKSQFKLNRKEFDIGSSIPDFMVDSIVMVTFSFTTKKRLR